MQLITPIERPDFLPQISYDTQMLVMGSCFAAEMGNRLQKAHFRCLQNPFGTLYNPLSISKALRDLMSEKNYTEEDLFEADGLWHSFAHHGSFSGADKTSVLVNMNRHMDEARQFLQKTGLLVLTWGTAWVYLHDGNVVANCHKQPDRMFQRKRLSVEEIVADYEDLLPSLPGDMQLMLTVSPIRYLRDGLHGSQLSKATLLLAIEQLRLRHPQRISYFPAFEIVLDELRDYRFYAEDMVHPTPVAAEYVWQRLVSWCMDKPTMNAMERVNKLKKALDHRPLHPDSPAYAQFLSEIMLNIDGLSNNWPYFDLSKEKEECLTRLNILRKL